MNFNALLEIMTRNKASDMFVTADKEPCIKVNGVLQPMTRNKLTKDQAMQVVTSIMNTAQREEFAKTHECNFAIESGELGRFRVSAMMQRDCAAMVLRRIQTNVPTWQELALPPILSELVMNKRGLILFVGGTGTGKSTSLASLIRHRNENSSGHIITIEDPLEYVHEHLGCIITQREVGIDTESFEVALKNTLRQAPDVILIGEIRTRETMQQAITFAETGHLCLSTLHANNANQAIDRILHFFPEEMHPQLFMDLSLNLRAIIAQQLIRSPDGKSRHPVIEILINTPRAADLIRKGEVHKLKELMKHSREQGMQTFDQCLFDLYRAGKIAYEDALRAADSQNEVRLMIKLAEDGKDPGAAASEAMTLIEEDEH
ncbi:MAG: PilT/PilU family type 4a pilus ATPase [Methylococcus sp.]|nr:MAG: PilT/PilU family type 4a pilus ATPase [Methylococcus sp.]